MLLSWAGNVNRLIKMLQFETKLMRANQNNKGVACETKTLKWSTELKLVKITLCGSVTTSDPFHITHIFCVLTHIFCGLNQDLGKCSFDLFTVCLFFVLTGREYQLIVTLLLTTGADVSFSICCVLLLHHTGGAVVVIQHDAIQHLGWIMAESFNREACLISPPERQRCYH